MSKHPSKCAQDNRANQLNPNHPAYYQSRGVPAAEAEGRAAHSKAALDNHADQLNPDNTAYRASRGESTQPGSSGSAAQSPAKSR